MWEYVWGEETPNGTFRPLKKKSQLQTEGKKWLTESHP